MVRPTGRHQIQPKGEPSVARGRLSRLSVLAAAMALVDREGLAALTMRRLAADLGVEPMALYRYAALNNYSTTGR